MTNLPANRKRAAKHATMLFFFAGIEAVNRAMVQGDEFEDMEGLQEISRRCRGLADLIDARMKEVKE